MEKAKNEITSKQTHAALIAASVFISCTAFIFAPLIEYAMTRVELWFNVGHFWWIILLCAIVAFGIFYGIGRLFRGKARVVYSCLLLGLGIAIFLQGNFLTIDVGPLNGDVKEWSLYSSQMTVNIIIFSLITLIPAIVCIFFDKIMLKLTRFISFLLIGVQALLFAMLFLTPVPAVNYTLSDKNLFTFSKNNNIIVFTIDMLDKNYIERALNDDQEFKKDLQGFTFYDNDSGKYSSTTYNFPMILNGNLNLNSGNLLEDDKSKQYFQTLKDNGYTIEAYGGASLMSEDFMKMCDNSVPHMSVNTDNIPRFTEYLYRLSGFRFLPDIFKPALWFYPGLEFNRLIDSNTGDIHPYLAINDKFYNKLTSGNITVNDSGNTFKSYYIFGNHYPYNTDANCQFVRPEVKYYETTKGMVLLLKELCSKLKAAGVYDNTTIVITGDHGWTGANSITAPALLIKTKGSTGDLVVSNTPVDHTVIVPTILQSVGIDSSKYGKTASEGVTDRKFYKSGLKIVEGDVGNLTEYSVPDNTNDQKYYEPSGFKYDVNGNYVSIYSYNDYTLGTSLDLNSKNCEYFDLGYSEGQSCGGQSQLTMKISSPKDLSVSIKVVSHFGDSQHIIAECNGQEVYEGVIKDAATINFNIPASSLKDGKLLLKLRYPDAVSQRQMDSNNDDATLYSIDFYELTIN